MLLYIELIKMNKKIIFAISFMVISLASIAIAQFSSITVTPDSYEIGMNGGETEFIDIELKSTSDETIPVELIGSVEYTGNCNNKGQWEDNADMVMSYCNSAGLDCADQKTFFVPPFGTLPVKIRHDTDIAACPGSYEIDTSVQFEEQETPLAVGQGYLHEGRSGYQLPRGPMRIFRELDTNELRLELNNVHDGFISRRCTITDHHFTYLSEKFVCKSATMGTFTLFIFPRFAVGFGNRGTFMGLPV